LVDYFVGKPFCKRSLCGYFVLSFYQKFGSLTIIAKDKLIHFIGWLRRPMIRALQSDGVAIGLSVLQNCQITKKNNINQY